MKLKRTIVPKEPLIFKTLNIDGKDKKCLCASYSQIDIFLQCPYKWFLTYLIGLRKQEKAEALDLGSAVHLTLEELLMMTKQGKHIEVGSAIDLLDINLERADIPFSSEQAKIDAINQHEEMVRGLAAGDNKLAKFLKGKEVVATEKDFVLEIDLPFEVKYKDETYKSVYIVGAIDLVVKDSDNNLYVVDYKSGKKTFDNKKLQTNLQLPIYSLVVLKQYGRLPVETMYYHTRFDQFQSTVVPYLNRGDVKPVCYKNGKVKFVPLSIPDLYDKLVEIFAQMYQSGDYPAKDTVLCCWCPFHHRYGDDSCPYGNETYWREDKQALKYY